MRRTLVVVLALSLASSLSGCGGDDPKVDPAPSASTSVSSSPTTTATEGGPPDDWESKFTASELAAAREAMHSWDEFRPLLDEIYQRGQLTPGVKATLQKYDFWWQRDMVDLEKTYEQGGLRLKAGVDALWSYARSVNLNHDGTGDIVIVQCTDYQPLRYSLNGQPQHIKKPEHPVTPLLITMTKPDGQHGWMRFKTDLKDKAPCAAE